MKKVTKKPKAKKVAKKAVKKAGIVRDNPVHIVCIQDKSGSMQGREADVIGGFNTFIEEQKKDTTKKAIVTLIQFDDKYEVPFSRVKLEDVKFLSRGDYTVRGSTALLDAIGKTIADCKIKGDKKVIISVHTDGQENASREYGSGQIAALIKECEKKGWGFVFLGADMNAFAAAGAFGAVPSLNTKIASTQTAAGGIAASALTMSAAVGSYRGLVGAPKYESFDANANYAESLKAVRTAAVPGGTAGGGGVGSGG